MNLVAKEYVAAQPPEDPGVLVLSCFAGAAQELQGALIVNPYDSDEIAEAMHRGLSMSLAERRDRWQAMHETVTSNTAERYCSIFMAHLARATGYPERPALRVIS